MAVQKPTSYSVEPNSAGELTKVTREPDGVSVPIDINAQEFNEFLTWASWRSPLINTDPYGIEPSSFYFADKEHLVNHCKRWGSLIAVHEPSPHLRFHTLERGDTLYRGTTEPAFYGLLKAVAPSEDTEVTSGGTASSRSNVFVTKQLFQELVEALQQEDDPVRRLSTWPLERCFVYLDVSDFSKHPAGQQALVINAIVNMVEEWQFWNMGVALDAQQAVEAKICIGDGYIFVIKNPVLAVYFAAYLAQVIEERAARSLTPVEFHFRMGVHIGPVYCFWDPGRRDWNFIGTGINGGQRVLAAIGKEADDVLFISGQVRKALTASNDGTLPCRQILSSLQNRGRKVDKHGGWWRVYEVNHTQLVSGALASAVRDYRGP